jgi:hypothetical protein
MKPTLHLDAGVQGASEYLLARSEVALDRSLVGRSGRQRSPLWASGSSPFLSNPSFDVLLIGGAQVGGFDRDGAAVAFLEHDFPVGV